MAKRTPLYQNHLNHGGKVVEFGGFELPVQYGAGLIAEHNAVRNAAGLFDVSHMGEFLLEGKSAFDTIQRLMSNDMTGLCDGQIRYTMMLNERGGEVDDLLVYRLSEEKYLLVVNAGNCDKDAAWVSNRLLDGTRFENLSEKPVRWRCKDPNRRRFCAKFCPKAKYPKNTILSRSATGLPTADVLFPARVTRARTALKFTAPRKGLQKFLKKYSTQARNTAFCPAVWERETL